MKGVLHSTFPDVSVVDLTHHVSPYDIRQGAWILLTSYRYFPPGTVFLAVVDPGVGTDRQAVAVETARYRFVGPDNGLLYPAVQADGVRQVVRLLVPEDSSRTFHGRDVFAPAAARLAAGARLPELGVPAVLRASLSFHRHGRQGEIVAVDSFGNLVTNLPPLDAGACRVRLFGQEAETAFEGVLPCLATYAAGHGHDLILITGSAGTLEIASPGGRAADRLPTRSGQRIEISPA